MINNNNTNFFSIRKEVIEIFRQQNPTGYFHLLYLIQEEDRVIIDDIRYPNELLALQERDFIIIKLAFQISLKIF